MEKKKTWLVYIVNQCEMGTEGWSGWSYYCVVQGNTDEEIYKNWLDMVKKVYDVDLSKFFKKHNGHYSCYYEVAKTELPTDVYGHAQPLEIIPKYIKHKD